MTRTAATLLCVFLLLGCASKSVETSKKESRLKLEDQKTLALASYMRKNYRQALEDITKAEKMDPRDPEVHTIKGLIYFNLREYDRAERAYKKALKLDKGFTQARYNLCGLYLTVKRWDDAVEQCGKAAEDFLYRSRDRAFTNLGVAYYQKGDYERAEEAFRQALEINPSLVYAHNELGKLLLKTGRTSEAIASFRLAVEGLDTYDEAHYNLGVAYLKQGDTERACEEFRRVVELAPQRLIGVNARGYLKTICKPRQEGPSTEKSLF